MPMGCLDYPKRPWDPATRPLRPPAARPLHRLVRVSHAAAIPPANADGWPDLRRLYAARFFSLSRMGRKHFGSYGSTTDQDKPDQPLLSRKRRARAGDM